MPKDDQKSISQETWRLHRASETPRDLINSNPLTFSRRLVPPSPSSWWETMPGAQVGYLVGFLVWGFGERLKQYSETHKSTMIPSTTPFLTPDYHRSLKTDTKYRITRKPFKINNVRSSPRFLPGKRTRVSVSPRGEEFRKE